jgi:16S rRNA C967 or C1407 C5-methylase (RsmB/RsmF family)
MVLSDKFREYLQEAIGRDRASVVIAAILTGEPELSVRINPRKWSTDGIVDSHLSKSLSGSPVPWCKEGLYLSERPVFTLDPALHAGAYYVQEPSSMILSLLEPFLLELSCSKSASHVTTSKNSTFKSSQQFSPEAGMPSGKIKLLDLCAAPGGKSTHLASIMPEGSSLTVNEVIRTRVGVLRENIVKWGYPNVDVTSLDAAEFPRRGYVFDFILVDAPCSGEGMFRKDPDAILEWSEESVKLSASRQKRILSDIWGSLSPGGLLAYSTCTMNRYEDENNIEWLIDNFKAEPVDLFADSQMKVNLGDTTDKIIQSSRLSKEDAEKAGILFSDNFTLRLHPGLVKGEGLFFALLRKPEGEEAYIPADKNSNKHYRQSDKPFFGSNKYDVSPQKSSGNFNQKQQRRNDPKSPGQKSPQVEVPEHNFALSLDYAGEWPSVELSKEDALTYLSRGTIKFAGQPLGYLRVTYGGLGLGFVKNLGTRANNLLPMNHRIRMQY